ncbi:MAG TPA: hypothetical protein PLY87_16375 [Planctomycetaceae bacterium]|nr:hypothetical protein [Planctomycetaceae bacterium]
MIQRGTIDWPVPGGEHFTRAQALTTTPGQNGWTAVLTGTSVTALCVTADSGALKLSTTATSESQLVVAYHNDVLAFDLRQLKYIEFVALVAGIDSVSTVIMGVASAHNATLDSIATNAWFRMQGSASLTAVVAETDDATNDNDDKATGQTLAAVYKTFKIDFEKGLSDVRFFIEGERVAAGTTFDMSALTAGLNVQPYIAVAKASGTGVPSITVAKVRPVYNYAYGA